MVGGDAGNSPGVRIGGSVGIGGAGPAGATAESARQALLLATQALGVNAAAVNEARKERDEERALRAAFEEMLLDNVGTGGVLVTAVSRGSLPMLRRALELGAGLDTRDEASGSTPLCLAAAFDQPDCVRLLVEEGADKDKTDSEGRAPVHLAARHSNVECLRLLLNAGADREKIWAKKGLTPLTRAVGLRNVNCIRVLLEAGADKDRKCGWGYTPLQIATRYNYLDCMRLLLEAGADASVRGHEGATALDLAVRFGHNEAAALLRQYGAPCAP